MELEEYRQPWDTDRSWELKKEFLTFYKDFLPEDKLKCLAQVYSNTELLQCSYPIPVMTQIQKLARHLKGCKQAVDHKSENKPKKTKRKNEDPPFLEITKFKKPIEDTEFLKKIQEKTHESLPDGLEDVDYKSIAQSENFDIVEKLSVEVQKLLKLQNENAYDIVLSAAMHLNVEELIDIKYTSFPTSDTPSNKYFCEFFVGLTKLAIGSGENRYLAKKKASENALNTLSNLPLIEKIGEEVHKLLNLPNKTSAYNMLLTAALNLGVEDLVKLEFSNWTVQGPNAEYTYTRHRCSFFIGATKIASFTGSSKKLVKRKASDAAIYILTHLKYLPKGKMEHVRVQYYKPTTQTEPSSEQLPSLSTSKSVLPGKWTRELLQKLAFEIKREYLKSQAVAHTLTQSFCRIRKKNDLAFDFYRDITGVFPQIYICKIMVCNTPLAEGKGVALKKAKQNAGENFIKLFLDLFERQRKSTDPSEDVYAEIVKMIEENSQKSAQILKNSSILGTESADADSKVKIAAATDIKDDEKLPNNFTNSNKEVTPPPKYSRNPHSINKRLYHNSIKQNFLLFDKAVTGIGPKTPMSDLIYSAQMCRRKFNQKCYPLTGNTYRVDMLLEDDILGSGVAKTKLLAKHEAARLIKEKLQNEIYTIKVKEGGVNLKIVPKDLAKLRFKRPEEVSKRKSSSRSDRYSSSYRRRQRIEDIICPGNEIFTKKFKMYAALCRNVNLNNMKSKIQTLLEGYSKSKAFGQLVFSEKFLPQEKFLIKGFARKVDLTHKKYIGKDDKNLYVKRKISVKELLDYLIKYGGKTEQYELLDLSE